MADTHQKESKKGKKKLGSFCIFCYNLPFNIV